MLNIKKVKIKSLVKRKCKKYSKDKIKEYLIMEFECTSTHGLPYTVDRSLHWCERLFWASSFIVCLCLVYVLLAPLYERYKRHPTVTSVEMDYFNWNVSYPAITLCPDYKTDDDAYAELIKIYFNQTGQDLSSYLWTISNVNLYTLERMDLQTPEIEALIPPEDYASIAADSFMAFQAQQVTTNTNSEISVDAVMTELGMCHTINSNMAVFDNPTYWKLTRKGHMKYVKNNIELSVYDGEFFTQVMNYADIYKISIHSPDEMIYSSSASYTHIKESFLFLGVMVSDTRISDDLKHFQIKNRNCRMINEPISERYPVYSYNHCLVECKIRMINQLCGCVPHWYKPLENERICSLQNLTCVMRYRPAILSLSVDQDTINDFPDINLPKSFKDCACDNNCEGKVYLKDQEEIIPHSSITRVKVGITSFPKIRIVKEVIFGFYDILLRSGGVINLCIGSSLISIMELIMTVVRPIVYHVVQHVKNLAYNIINMILNKIPK